MGAAHQLTTPTQVREFMLAGNAILTTVSKKTGARFTFKVTCSDQRHWWVKYLRGQDNTRNYKFLGTIFQERGGLLTWRLSRRGLVSPEAPVARAFEYLVQVLNHAQTELPVNLEVWHEGRCGRCGRLLTVPESIARGLGPECAKDIDKNSNLREVRYEQLSL